MRIDTHTLRQQATERIVSMLPDQIKEFGELIGFEAALLLVEHLGGLSFEMPQSLDSKNGKWLVAILGKSAAQKLIDVYGGDSTYINNCDALHRELRNLALCDAIYARMETGVSHYRAVQETAPQFGLTERRVYDILKQMNSPVMQLGLF